MKTFFTKAIIFVSLAQIINPVYSSEVEYKTGPMGYKWVETDYEDSSSDIIIEPTMDTDLSYPLLSSQNINNLISQTWGTLNEEKNLEIGASILDLLLVVSNEVRGVDAETVLGDNPAVFADNIVSSVEQIREHAFDSVQHKINCIWSYSDGIIRYLGNTGYTIIG